VCPLAIFDGHDVLLDILRNLLAKDLPRAASSCRFLADAVRFGRLMHAVALPSHLYVIGGQSAVAEPESALRSVEVFDGTQEGGWTPVAPMKTARANPSAVACGKFLLVMGSDGQGEKFDPAKGTWSSLPPLPRSRFVQVMLAASGGGLYVVGLNNKVGESGKVECSCFVDHLDAGTWKEVSTRRIAGGWIGSCRVTGHGDDIYLVAWGNGAEGTAGKGLLNRSTSKHYCGQEGCRRRSVAASMPSRRVMALCTPSGALAPLPRQASGMTPTQTPGH
jgi:hypothetical protein